MAGVVFAIHLWRAFLDPCGGPDRVIERAAAFGIVGRDAQW